MIQWPLGAFLGIFLCRAVVTGYFPQLEPMVIGLGEFREWPSPPWISVGRLLRGLALGNIA